MKIKSIDPERDIKIIKLHLSKNIIECMIENINILRNI